MKSKEFSLLFSLLRAALWQTPPDAALFVDINEDSWKKIMNLAAHHSVFALTFDGAMLLPTQAMPPRPLQLTWVAQIDRIEQQYAYKLSVLKEMETLFSQNGIKMLHFKGFALAQCFPVPEHRQFGDLDIYLFWQTKQGHRLLLENGATPNYRSYKHLCVIYKKVMIENHAYFLNTHDSRKIKASDKMLKKIISDSEESLSWTEFPVDFQALFYMFHTIHHFSWEAFSVKLLIDLAAFWKTNLTKIDIERYRQALKSVNLIKQADAITSLTVNFLQIDKNCVPPFEIDRILEDKMLYYMFFPYVPTKIDDGFIPILKLKWERFFHRAKSYELVYPGENYKRFISSLISNLKNRTFLKS